MDTRINREELICKIKGAKKCVRVLGTVAFNLPFDDLKEIFFEKINDDSDFKLEIIIESDSLLSYDALISANRKVSGEGNRFEFGVLKDIADEPIKKLRQYLVDKNCKHLEPAQDLKNPELSEKDKKQKFFIKTFYLSPKIPVIQIDDEYYISYALTKFNKLEFFEQITPDHLWYEEFKKYFYAYFDADEGAQKYATEYTTKGNKLEVIEMYNERRIPLGQLPRDSFLDLTRPKVVIWGLIFARNGKLLIHKRGANAKDNRDMWDKSAGGHVDIEKDVDTVQAASREIIEELRTAEDEGQGGHNKAKMFDVNTSYLIFLGEWRPEYRYEKLYEEIEYNKTTDYYFRMKYDESRMLRNSPRILPNGQRRLVRCFADIYVCVANETFENDVKNGKLENSDYLLLYPEQIKDLYEYGDCILDEEDVSYYTQKIKTFDESSNKNKTLPFRLEGNSFIYNDSFKVTPDLEGIINSELWEKEISAFSNTLKERYKKNH